MRAYLVFAFVSVNLMCIGSALKWGRCPEIPLQENFSLDSYLGEWREAVRKIDTPFEQGNCGYAKYSVKEDGNLKINNTMLLEDGSSNTAIGSAYQTKKNPAYLRLTFFWPFYGDYKVVETDYNDYAVVYSCSNYVFFHTDLAWILTRNKNYDAENEGQLDTLKSLGVDRSQLMIHDLSACPDSI